MALNSFCDKTLQMVKPYLKLRTRNIDDVSLIAAGDKPFKNKHNQLRARSVLLHFKDVPLRTRRAIN